MTTPRTLIVFHKTSNETEDIHRAYREYLPDVKTQVVPSTSGEAGYKQSLIFYTLKYLYEHYAALETQAEKSTNSILIFLLWDGSCATTSDIEQCMNIADMPNVPRVHAITNHANVAQDGSSSGFGKPPTAHQHYLPKTKKAEHISYQDWFEHVYDMKYTLSESLNEYDGAIQCIAIPISSVFYRHAGFYKRLCHGTEEEYRYLQRSWKYIFIPKEERSSIVRKKGVKEHLQRLLDCKNIGIILYGVTWSPCFPLKNESEILQVNAKRALETFRKKVREYIEGAVPKTKTYMLTNEHERLQDMCDAAGGVDEVITFSDKEYARRFMDTNDGKPPTDAFQQVGQMFPNAWKEHEALLFVRADLLFMKSISTWDIQKDAINGDGWLNAVTFFRTNIRGNKRHDMVTPLKGYKFTGDNYPLYIPTVRKWTKI